MKVQILISKELDRHSVQYCHAWPLPMFPSSGIPYIPCIPAVCRSQLFEDVMADIIYWEMGELLLLISLEGRA